MGESCDRISNTFVCNHRHLVVLLCCLAVAGVLNVLVLSQSELTTGHWRLLTTHRRVQMISGAPRPTHHSAQKPARMSWQRYVKEMMNSGGQTNATFHVRHNTTATNTSLTIIVPFRNRSRHLRVLLPVLRSFLASQRPLTNTRLVVAEQAAGLPYNKGRLMNAAFVSATSFQHKVQDDDCFIFHDVDLLPLSLKNKYECDQQHPRHLSPAVDTLNNSLPYPWLVGGVLALTRRHFLSINGFSNDFWRWGGEDDEVSARLYYGRHLVPLRPPSAHGRYLMMSHVKSAQSRRNTAQSMRNFWRFKTDGLNSLEYQLLRREKTALNSRFLINFTTSLPSPLILDDIPLKTKGQNQRSLVTQRSLT